MIDDCCSFATQLVHAGERRIVPSGVPASTPIYATSSFVYETMEEVDQIVDGEKSDFVYSRYGNPTVAALEDALAAIEAGEFAVAYGSGMAALHAALLACDLKTGSVVLASQDLYGATLELLTQIFGAFGIKTVTADFADTAALREKALATKPRVLLAETLSNPLLKVLNVTAVAAIARETNAKFVVDNTFATPFLCQPLTLGADFSVHSTTKFLGGHADSTGGAVIARDQADRAALFAALTLAGGVLSPWEAHQILRGVKTLALRLEKQCRNAEILANHLALSPAIETVIYPKFRAGETENQTLRQSFYGAIVSVRLTEDTKGAAYQFLNNLKLCTRAASVGDIFTGIVHPATATHRDVLPAKRQKLGITDGLLRISVGIEDVADIIADIEQALQLVAAEKPKILEKTAGCYV